MKFNLSSLVELIQILNPSENVNKGVGTKHTVPRTVYLGYSMPFLYCLRGMVLGAFSLKDNLSILTCLN